MDRIYSCTCVNACLKSCRDSSHDIDTFIVRQLVPLLCAIRVDAASAGL